MTNEKNFDFLRAMREEELSRVCEFITPPATVLELGAGSGWQAKILSERGFTITAIDVEGGRDDGGRVYPVSVYDGVTLPFELGSFQYIFSSNVLEHVEHPRELMHECSRVLVPGGYAVHVVPTSSWRFYNSIAHYVAVIQYVFGSRVIKTSASSISKMRISAKIKMALWAGRHGENGTMLSEFYLFSRRGWKEFFRNNGWEVISVGDCGIAYSGYTLMGHRMSHRARKWFARLFGSSATIWVIRPQIQSS